MNITDKKKIVRSSITQAGVPVLFDDVVAASEIYTDTLQVTITENGVTTIKAEDIDREEREAQGLTPYDGMSTVEVTVDTPVTNVQASKSVEYTENGEFTVSPDEGYDAVAEVTVTVDAGPVTPTNPGAVSTLAELADYAKICDVYGAVLSVNSGQYLIWNDVVGSQTWNPSAIEETPVAPSGHGTNIAICIGDGVWIMIGWTGLSNSLMFANSNTDLHSAFLSGCVKGSGKDNSDYILANYGTDPDVATKYPLWDALKTLRETYAGAYIPNPQELRNICFKLATVPSTSGSFEYNTNIAKVFGVDTNSYWSSSQCVNSGYNAYSVLFDNGGLGYDGKDGGYYSFAVLSFDTPTEVQDQGIGVE